MAVNGSQLRALLFTDLVGSSAMKVQLGDTGYVEMIAGPHNAIFRKLLRMFPGSQESNFTGDGFFATFARVSDAVDFALLFHHQLRTYPWRAYSPQTRVGIHVGQSIFIDGVNQAQMLITSHAADTCARLMGLAMGGQTLLTKNACDDARQFVRSHPALEDGSQAPPIDFKYLGLVRFKGNEKQPVEVYEVGAVGIAPLARPADSEKARWFASIEEEQLLNWLPGVGREIPGRPKWVIQSKLGQGGFGEVWLARHMSTQSQRVFKFCFDVERLNSFKRELAVFQLIHQALGERRDISRIMDIRLDQPPYYLESEYIAGGNLLEWAKRGSGLGRIDLNDRLGVFVQIARAVAAAHKVGVIHKDIKPANILVEESADGKPQMILSDFGIGEFERSRSGNPSSNPELPQELSPDQKTDSTTNPITQGTRMYTAPELFSGQPASLASDVYALGVLLYQISVGDFNQPLAIGWERHLTDTILKGDIRACVEGNPAERLQSAEELATRIERIQERQADAKKMIITNALKAQSKASIELTAIILLPVVVLMLLSLWGLYDQLLQYSSNRLHTIAQTTAGRLDDQLAEGLYNARQIALSGPVVGVCKNPADVGQGTDSIDHVLESVTKSHPHYTLTFVVDMAGKVIATSDPTNLGRDLSFRDYVQSALKGTPATSGLIFGSYIKAPGVFHAAPVFDPDNHDRVIGALVLKLDAARVWEIVDQIKIGQRGYTMLVDENNVVISHPDPKKMFHSLADLTPGDIALINPSGTYGRDTLASLDIPELARTPQRPGEVLVFSSPLDDGTGSATANDEREYWTAGHWMVSGLHWHIYCAEPQWQFLRPITNMLVTQASIGMLVIFIALVLIIWRARRLARLQLQESQE